MNIEDRNVRIASLPSDIFAIFDIFRQYRFFCRCSCVIAIVSVDSNFIEEILFIVKCRSNYDTLM